MIKYCDKHPNQKMIELFSSWACDECDGKITINFDSNVPNTIDRYIVTSIVLPASLHNITIGSVPILRHKFSYKDTQDTICHVKRGSVFSFIHNEIEMEFKNWTFARDGIFKRGDPFILENPDGSIWEVDGFREATSNSNSVIKEHMLAGYATSIKII